MAPLAVVSGASSGIGAAIARRLGEQGHDLVLLARRDDRLAEVAAQTGGRAMVLDITDEAAVRRAAAAIGMCDVLVNNAGGAVGAESVAAADPADWQAMFSVNVLGTLRVTQAFLPLLRASSGATIINITSTAAMANYEGGGGYSAAKHAEHALTETLRLELSGEPIRVIEIVPGMVQTEEFALNRFRGDAARAAMVYENVDHPLTAVDIAECVAFAVTLPQHVNVDQLVVRPLAQAAQHKTFRGRLFTPTSNTAH